MMKAKYGAAIHVRLSPEQHSRLFELADIQQTRCSHLARLAVVEFLERRGYKVRNEKPLSAPALP